MCLNLGLTYGTSNMAWYSPKWDSYIHFSPHSWDLGCNGSRNLYVLPLFFLLCPFQKVIGQKKTVCLYACERGLENGTAETESTAKRVDGEALLNLVLKCLPSALCSWTELSQKLASGINSGVSSPWFLIYPIGFSGKYFLWKRWERCSTLQILFASSVV